MTGETHIPAAPDARHILRARAQALARPLERSEGAESSLQLL